MLVVRDGMGNKMAKRQAKGGLKVYWRERGRERRDCDRKKRKSDLFEGGMPSGSFLRTKYD